MKLKDWNEKSRKAEGAKAADEVSGREMDSGEQGPLPDMDEEWEETVPEDGWEGFAPAGEDGWEDSPSDMEEGWDRAGDPAYEWGESGQEPEGDGQRRGRDGEWREASLASKPNVAYKWKKIALDPEPDGDDREASAPDGEREEPRPDSGKSRKDSLRSQGFANRRTDMEEEGELAPLKPWVKALVFLGLVVAAAAICALLWRFVHPDKPDGQEGLSQTAVPSESSSQQSPEPDLDLSGTEEGEESGPDLLLDPTQSPAPEPDVTQPPATESDGNPSQEPDTGSSTQEPAEQEPAAGNEDMTFQAVQESVTPKDVVNLRLVPTTRDSENIAAQAKNGETLSRVGINEDTGWSKIDYNGQTLYAVSQYLTTDLNYKPPVQPSDPNRVSTISGRIVIFTSCDDWISPKEYVNLRTEPSTTEGDATVSCQLNSGERAHRTGYSTDSGWSRVEYNGQVLYVVTSLIYEVSGE